MRRYKAQGIFYAIRLKLLRALGTARGRWQPIPRQDEITLDNKDCTKPVQHPLQVLHTRDRNSLGLPDLAITKQVRLGNSRKLRRKNYLIPNHGSCSSADRRTKEEEVHCRRHFSIAVEPASSGGQLQCAQGDWNHPIGKICRQWGQDRYPLQCMG